MRSKNIILQKKSNIEKRIKELKEGINSKNILIQIFTSILDKNYIHKVLIELNKEIPNSVILGMSSSGEIEGDNNTEETMLISLTEFKYTKLETHILEHNNKDYKNTAEELEKKISKDNTKIIISFANSSTNGEDYLKGFNKPVAGGISSNNDKQESLIFDNRRILNNGAVAVSLNSHILTIKQEAHLNWEKVGIELEITKSEKNRVYEINKIKAIEFYKYYLGDEIENLLPNIGNEFPLLKEEKGKILARAVLEKKEDGSLIFGGNLNEGDKVHLGYGHKEKIAEETYNKLVLKREENIESIFIYSCLARKKVLKELIKQELELINDKSENRSIGLFTHGEFYSENGENLFLNESLTYLALSEKQIEEISDKSLIKNTKKEFNSEDALINLLTRTSKDMELYLSKLEIKNKAIDESLIYSETDLRGVITYASEAFCKISGYSKEELIGKPHNIIKSPNSPNILFEELWNKIKNNKDWEGIIVNKKKNGDFYTTKALIKPMFFKGKKIGYNSQRIDITDLENNSKLTEMGEFLSLISHQWKQPLTVLNMLNEKVKRKLYKKEYEDIEDLSYKIEDNINYMIDTINDFNGYFKNDINKKEISINELLISLQSLIKPLLDINDIEFKKIESEILDKKYLLNKNNLTQVLLTIIKNGIDVFNKSIKNIKYLEFEAHEKNNKLYIYIRNNGGHIKKEIINKIFNKNFTTKDKKGSGLGLYMSKIILKKHMSGIIEVLNKDKDIVEFKIIIDI